MGRSSADQRDLLPKQVGARIVLPDFFLRNQGLVCLVGGANGPYTDNLCFFRCLAVHRGTPDVKALEVPAKTYYHQYLQYKQMTSKDFQGVCLDDLMVLEQLFSLNVYVYDLQETEEGDIAARLEDEGIDVPEKKIGITRAELPMTQVMLQPTDKRRSEKLEWTSHHVLLSVSVCSNVPEYKVPVCYISENGHCILRREE